TSLRTGRRRVIPDATQRGRAVAATLPPLPLDGALVVGEPDEVAVLGVCDLHLELVHAAVARPVRVGGRGPGAVLAGGQRVHLAVVEGLAFEVDLLDHDDVFEGRVVGPPRADGERG